MFVKLMPGNAAPNGSENGMVSGVVPGNASRHRPRDTANGLCLNRGGEGRECSDDDKCAHGCHPASAPIQRNAGAIAIVPPRAPYRLRGMEKMAGLLGAGFRSEAHRRSTRKGMQDILPVGCCDGDVVRLWKCVEFERREPSVGLAASLLGR